MGEACESLVQNGSAMWTTLRSALLCGAVLLVCSNWAAATQDDSGDSDHSDGLALGFPGLPGWKPAPRGGPKCMRSKKCGRAGGECVPMGKCKTVEMFEQCSKKDEGECVCCAKDKKYRCKAYQNRPCLDLGGFCVKKKRACAQGYLLPGQCNCEGKDPEARRGHCCLPRGPPPPPTTPPPPPSGSTPDPWVLIGSEYYQIIRTPSTDWYAARDMCIEMGSDLAVLDTEAKRSDMMSYLIEHGGKYFWLGGNDFSGEYAWITGEPVSSDAWNAQYYGSPPTYDHMNVCLFTWPENTGEDNDMVFLAECEDTNSNLHTICQK